MRRVAITMGVLLTALTSFEGGAAAEATAATAVRAVDTVWVLLAAFLVFFMQAGFGMVEAGFIRASEGIGYTAQEGPFGVIELELDHIFTKGMTVIDAGKVEATVASDHLPIWLIAKIRSE